MHDRHRTADEPHSRRTWLRPRKSPLRRAASVHRRGVKVGARVVHRQHVSTLEQQTMENTMNHANKLSVLIALAASVAMPMAFAQTAPTTDDGMQPTSPHATAPTSHPYQLTSSYLYVSTDFILINSEFS